MILGGMSYSFKRELLEGVHVFATDVFKLALYTPVATLNQLTTNYTTTGEVVGAGYVAGGATLTTIAPTLSDGAAIVDFADVVWPVSSITAIGGLIYNSSKANRSVMALNFGIERSSNPNFTVVFPTPDSVSGILRIA